MPGRSKYGNLARPWRGLFDVVGLLWLERRLLRSGRRGVLTPATSTPDGGS